MEDLKELIIQTLDAQGVLDKIRAQLRLQVFKAVQNDEGKMQNDNSKPVKVAQSPDGILAAALLRDFLECYKMKYSLNVLIPEFHLPQNQDVRAFLSKELKFMPEAGEPFLTFMTKFLLKDSEGSSREDPKRKEEVKEPKLLSSLPDPKSRVEPKPVEKKTLPQIPEFKPKPAEEKKPLAQIPDFKPKPVEEQKDKKPLAQIPDFRAKPAEVEKKPLGQIPEFKGKGAEDKQPEKKNLPQIPDFKPKTEEPKPVDKKPQVPELKTKPEERVPEKKSVPEPKKPEEKKSVPEPKKPEEKPVDKKPLAQIPEFKGKAVEDKPIEKKPLPQIPEFRGKLDPKAKEEPKKSQIPEPKGKARPDDVPSKPSKDVLPNNKNKVPQILLPDIDSPESSGRLEDSNEKGAIDDVKKRLKNYGNYMDEFGEDISSKKFEFDNYEDSQSYESDEYYQDLSDDPSMHSEYLEDYDIVESAEIVETDEEGDEASSNS